MIWLIIIIFLVICYMLLPNFIVNFFAPLSVFVCSNGMKLEQTLIHAWLNKMSRSIYWQKCHSVDKLLTYIFLKYLSSIDLWVCVNSSKRYQQSFCKVIIKCLVYTYLLEEVATAFRFVLVNLISCWFLLIFSCNTNLVIHYSKEW